jgi:uncharacterized protein
MYEWDEQKRLVTLSKHEIDFVDAVEIFGGKFLLLNARSELEARQKAIAPLGPKMICVVFTLRDDKIRIITARVARKNEREKYQELYSGTDQSDEGPD